MKKKLFCDIDSTINNHWVRIQRNKNDISKAFSREQMMTDVPLKDSKESLEELSNDYEIHFLTARGEIQDGYNITKDWLDLYGFSYESINLVKKTIEKVDFLIENKSDLLIDDLSRLQQISGSYVHLYNDVIYKLKSNNIKFLIFKGDWRETLQQLRGE